MLIETYESGSESVNDRSAANWHRLPDEVEYVDSWIDSESLVDAS